MGTSYLYSEGTYYAKVFPGGAVVYQVVPPPPGAIIVALPSGCQSVSMGGVTYSRCGTTCYRRVSSGLKSSS